MPKPAFRRPWALGFACLLLVGVATLPRGAAAQTQGPEAFISHFGTEGIAALDPAVPPAVRAARFRQLFQNDFDLPEIARFVLGPYRNALAPPQQREFYGLFREYLVHSYAEKLKNYAGDQFRVIASRPWGGGTLVYSEVVRQDGRPIAIDWQVADRGGRYLITDVYVDQVSMKLSERNEFAAIIQRNGGRPDALIAALRERLAYGS